MNSGKFIRSNILITLLTLVSVGFNFISQMVLAYYFGASDERDSYFSAIVIPTYITALFVGSVTVIALPFYVDLEKKNNEEGVNRFISSSLGLCALFLICIAIIGFLLSRKIISLVAPGFSLELQSSTEELFRILIFIIIFQCLSSFLTIFYHVKNHFLLPAINPIIVAFTSMLFIIVFNKYGIKIMAIGTLVGSILSTLVLLTIVHDKLRVRDFFLFANTDTINLIKMTLPLLAAGALYRITPVAERFFASKLPSGSISYLGYGNQIYTLLATIASGSIATTFYPSMSKLWAEGNKLEFNQLFGKGVKLILFITLPIAAIFISLSYPITKILFERGAFSENTTRAVSNVIAILMGAFIFTSLGNILMKLFYITKRSTTISIINIIEVITYLIMGYYLSSQYSYLGLAIALTLSIGITIILSVGLSGKEVSLFVNNLHWDVLKLFLAALVCGGVAVGTYFTLTSINIIVATVLSALAALTSYLIVIWYVLKFQYHSIVMNFVKKIFLKTLL